MKVKKNHLKLYSNRAGWNVFEKQPMFTGSLPNCKRTAVLALPQHCPLQHSTV